jgi:hypothetical protein
MASSLDPCLYELLKAISIFGSGHPKGQPSEETMLMRLKGSRYTLT